MFPTLIIGKENFLETGILHFGVNKFGYLELDESVNYKGSIFAATLKENARVETDADKIFLIKIFFLFELYWWSYLQVCGQDSFYTDQQKFGVTSGIFMSAIQAFEFKCMDSFNREKITEIKESQGYKTGQDVPVDPRPFFEIYEFLFQKILNYF